MQPQTGFPLFLRATRAKVLPVMLAPVAVGASLGWARWGVFSWGWFLVTLAGAAAMHLGANVINDVYDEESGAETVARADYRSIATGSGVLGSGVMTRVQLLRLAAVLFGIGLACGVALAIARGPAVLVLGAIGFVLAFEYVGPPLRYGYLGRGLGELGIFASFGVLPVLGSYYVQTGRIDATGWGGTVIPGLLTTLVLFHHHFLHWHADKEARKMTPVAVLGPMISIGISRIAIIVFVIVLAVQSLVAGLWPPGAMAAALAAAPVAAAQRRAHDEPGNETFVRLLGASLGASILAAAVLVVSNVARALIR